MTLIVVSGPSGSGKSTLAHLLGRRVGCPVISRDEIREGIVLAGTPDPDMRHTYRVFTDTVTSLVAAGVTVIAEAAFQNHLWQPILAPLLADPPAPAPPLSGPERFDVRILRCRISAASARERIAARAATGPPRIAHSGRAPVPADEWVPISLDVPTLEVDASDGYHPPLASIVEFVS
jgi:predicted kinase